MGLLTQFNEARTTAKPSERHTRATHDKKVHRVRELNVQNETGYEPEKSERILVQPGTEGSVTGPNLKAIKTDDSDYIKLKCFVW